MSKVGDARSRALVRAARTAANDNALSDDERVDGLEAEFMRALHDFGQVAGEEAMWTVFDDVRSRVPLRFNS